MLILTRRLGETITIGDETKVTVLGVYGRQVRLGIEAPRTVEVHRQEVYDKIQAEKPLPEPSQTKPGRKRIKILGLI